jgi:hypothetical protein
MPRLRRLDYASMGTAVEILRGVLERYDDFKGRFAVPGEGGERAFRAWLVLDLLHHHFRWPSRLILVGERHDVLLLNEQLFPIITIETKEPRHEASKTEKAKFEERLPHYTTLQHAFLTDGFNWLQLTLSAPAGRQTIAARGEIDIAEDEDADIDEFLARLDAAKYISETYE